MQLFGVCVCDNFSGLGTYYDEIFMLKNLTMEKMSRKQEEGAHFLVFIHQFFIILISHGLMILFDVDSNKFRVYLKHTWMRSVKRCFTVFLAHFLGYLQLLMTC